MWWLAALVSCLPTAAPAARGTLTQLQPPVFAPLPLRELTTRGWLRRQMDLAAGGLAGNEHLIWPWLRDSQFLGRCKRNYPPNTTAVSECEGWQFSTYAMNGLVPLSYLGSPSATASLRNFSRVWMDYQKAHQEPDGWVGPGSVKNPIVNQGYTNETYDTYPSLMHLMAMAQYHDATMDSAILGVMSRLMHKISALYAESRQCVRPTSGPRAPGAGGSRDIWPICGGGACFGGICKCCVTTRYPELVWSAEWLFDKTQDPWLLTFVEQIHNTVATETGPSWVDFFKRFNCTKAYTAEACGDQHLVHHGVDIAEGIKYGALRWRLTGDPADLEASLMAIQKLWKYHGQADGVMSNDENLGGLLPQHGTETCSVVETLFSLETVAMVSGKPEVADALERVAYNALPGFSTPNQWGHVYFQYSNQPRSGVPKGQTHYKTWAGTIPCCTANHPQGWSKFSSNLVAKSTTTDGKAALTVVQYAPIDVNTTLATGQQVQLTVETDYPWREEITFHVRVRGGDRRFPLCFRIPGWCDAAQITAHSAGVLPPAQLPNGSYACAEMADQDSLTLRLPMGSGRVERRVNNAAVILRGPLVYSLPVSESWQGGIAPSKALALSFGDAGFNLAVENTTQWAFALNLSSLRFAETPGPLPAMPWARSMPHATLGWAAPVTAEIEAFFVPEWAATTKLGGLNAPCGPLERSRVSREPRLLTLQPYGSTELRISEWPVLAGAMQPPGAEQACVKPPAPPGAACKPFNASLTPNAVPDTNLPCMRPFHPDPGCDLIPHGTRVQGIEECWRLCGANAACRAYTYSWASPSHGGAPWCWLKNASNMTPQRRACFISGSCKAGTAFPCVRTSSATLKMDDAADDISRSGIHGGSSRTHR